MNGSLINADITKGAVKKTKNYVLVKHWSRKNKNRSHDCPIMNEAASMAMIPSKRQVL
jgi:hypothetical protein